MEFGDDFYLLLPNYLANEEKGRLRDALKQFSVDERGKEINYSDFYKSYGHA